VSPGARAEAPQPRLPHPTRLQVTGQVLSPLEYLRRGFTPRQAQVVAPLDRLVAHGADRHLVQTAVDVAQDDEVVTAEPGGSTVTHVALVPVGDLDGRSGKDVLEARYVSVKGRTTLLLVAREGGTGTPLWSRRIVLEHGDAAMPLAAQVGAGGRPGVVLYRSSFDGDSVTRLEALDGAGRTRWTRSLSVPRLPSDDGGVLGYSFASTWVFVMLDARLHRTGQDVLVVVQRDVVTDDGVRWSVHGDAQALAVSQDTGALRPLTSRVASADAYVNADLAGDQTGDGLLDLTFAVGGSAPRVSVLRGYDGAKVWTRTDLAMPLWGDLAPAQAWERQARGVPALAFVSGRDPGRLHLGVELPVPPYEVPVDDPTAGAHGTVALLAPRTGRTLWSRAGDQPYSLSGGLLPLLGVVTDTSAVSPVEATAAVQLDVLRPDGTVAWSRSYSYSKPTTPLDGGYAYAAGFPLTDLDGDGSDEGLVFLAVVTDDWYEQVTLIGSGGGQPLRDQSSSLLGGGVTRVGQDRYRVRSSAAGETLTVLRGRDGGTAFSRLVPGSKGVRYLDAQAHRLGSAVCADVLVAGTGDTRAVLGVLASDGSPRWWVSGTGADVGVATAVRPARAPAPRC
jgi:hypothetical protein